MKNRLWPAALCGIGLAAAVPAGYDHVTDAQFKQGEAELRTQMKDGLASRPVANWGNHLMSQAHRDANGQAEFHEKQADVLIIRGGSGTFVVGGKVVGGKTTAPGEIRGASIEGGQKLAVHAGDVIHVPVRTAHQFLLSAGQQVDYLAIKVDVP